MGQLNSRSGQKGERRTGEKSIQKATGPDQWDITHHTSPQGQRWLKRRPRSRRRRLKLTVAQVIKSTEKTEGIQGFEDTEGLAVSRKLHTAGLWTTALLTDGSWRVRLRCVGLEH